MIYDLPVICGGVSLLRWLAASCNVSARNTRGAGFTFASATVNNRVLPGDGTYEATYLAVFSQSKLRGFNRTAILRKLPRYTPEVVRGRYSWVNVAGTMTSSVVYNAAALAQAANRAEINRLHQEEITGSVVFKPDDGNKPTCTPGPVIPMRVGHHPLGPPRKPGHRSVLPYRFQYHVLSIDRHPPPSLLPY